MREPQGAASAAAPQCLAEHSRASHAESGVCLIRRRRTKSASYAHSTHGRDRHRCLPCRDSKPMKRSNHRKRTKKGHTPPQQSVHCESTGSPLIPAPAPPRPAEAEADERPPITPGDRSYPSPRRFCLVWNVGGTVPHAIAQNGISRAKNPTRGRRIGLRPEDGD